jgi:short-subunit dehydrogenase
MNIIVTGASRGIGYELAACFASDTKNSVLAISRNAKKLEDLREECMLKYSGCRLNILPFDLEDTVGIEGELRHRIEEYYDSLDVLVNNAGFLVKKSVLEIDPSDARRMMNVNVLAPLVLVRTLVPLLEKSGNAHVVNIGSMAGVAGGKKFPGLSAYSASKGAVHILTECLAVELGDQNIRCNALALGSVETEMLAAAFPGLEAPLKAAEMASFIRQFALEGHRYFNGKTLPVAVSTP